MHQVSRNILANAKSLGTWPMPPTSKLDKIHEPRSIRSLSVCHYQIYWKKTMLCILCGSYPTAHNNRKLYVAPTMRYKDLAPICRLVMCSSSDHEINKNGKKNCVGSHSPSLKAYPTTTVDDFLIGCSLGRLLSRPLSRCYGGFLGRTLGTGMRVLAWEAPGRERLDRE